MTITDRGRAIARIVPLADEEPTEQRLADLVAAGVLSQPSIADVPEADPKAARPGALERFLRERD